MNDDLPQSGTGPRPGEDLYGLSVEELRKRISLYEGEIKRLGVELAKKESERSAADMIFKPKS